MNAYIVLASGTPPFTLNLIQDIQDILSFGFMRNALLAGTAIALSAGIIGYFVIIRHQAFAGESLTDVAFTSAVGATAFAINPLFGLFAGTAGVALLMGGLGERLRGRDIAIGTVLVWVLGLGDLFLNIFTKMKSGTGTGFSGVTVLFGSILGISTTQAQIITVIGICVLIITLIIARPLLFASLDPDVAASRGVPTRALGLFFMMLLAITAGEATQAVGAMLAFALMLLPAAIAQQVTLHPYAGLAAAAFIAVLVTWVGIAAGFYLPYPISVCISLIAFTGYVGVHAGKLLWRRVRLV